MANPEPVVVKTIVSTVKEFWTEASLSVIFFLWSIFSSALAAIFWICPSLPERLVKSRFSRVNIKCEPNATGPLGVNVTNPGKFYSKVAIERSFGLFESHIDGYCVINDVKRLCTQVMESKLSRDYCHPLSWINDVFNTQSRARAWKVGQLHYDVGNNLYEKMLDKNMQYTCAYWKDATNLDEAQEAKMNLIARKMHLKQGMRVLDLGCGFGTLARFLAKNYGVSVVGCTISAEQAKYGQAVGKSLPVDIRLCDYRDMYEEFDRIVSIGLLEHVGPHNYRELFQVAERCLKKDGIFLLHAIGNNDPRMSGVDLWVDKYIFPNSAIPYYLDVCKAMEGLWIIEDWHNFSFDYSKTLAAWEVNFDEAWPKLRLEYGERFYKMWKLYLQLAHSLFTTRSYQLWQIVLSKEGVREGYIFVR